MPITRPITNETIFELFGEAGIDEAVSNLSNPVTDDQRSDAFHGFYESAGEGKHPVIKIDGRDGRIDAGGGEITIDPINGHPISPDGRLILRKHNGEITVLINGGDGRAQMKGLELERLLVTEKITVGEGAGLDLPENLKLNRLTVEEELKVDQDGVAEIGDLENTDRNRVYLIVGGKTITNHLQVNNDIIVEGVATFKDLDLSQIKKLTLEELTVNETATIKSVATVGDLTDREATKNYLVVGGKTTTNHLKVNNDLTVDGKITTQELEVTGTVKTPNLELPGKLEVKELEVDGKTSTQELEVKGPATIPNLKLPSKLELEELDVKDVATIKDLTVAGTPILEQDLTVANKTTTTDLEVIGTVTDDLEVDGKVTTQELEVKGPATIPNLKLPSKLELEELDVKGKTTTQDLTVNGTTRTADVVVTNSDGEESIKLNRLGEICFPLAADCAEDFDIIETEEIEPGMVMVLNQDGKLRPSATAYDNKVVGVISGAGGYRPGIVLDQQPNVPGKRLPLALMGKVYCKVDADQTPIEVGDLLTTSPTPGHAMKASDPIKAFGAIIGKALRPLESGKELVPVLVALQ